MKELGNLAIVCAKRPEVLMQIHNGEVAVHVGAGPERASMVTAWDDNEGVSKIVYELNFGKYRAEEHQSTQTGKEMAA